MGCWNETCQLTNLPIQRNDPVMLLITIQRYNLNPQYYIDDQAIPFCLPITGIYNEYGCIDDPKIHPYTETLLTKTRFYDTETHIELNMDLNELLRAICENKVCIIAKPETTPNQSVYKQLGVCFYHWYPYNLVIHELRKTSDPKNSYQDRYEKLKIHQLTLLKQIQDLKEMQCTPDVPPLIPKYGKPWNMTQAYQQTLTEDQVSPYIRKLVNFLDFCNALAILRRGFFGYSGKGSQTTGLKLHKTLAQWIIHYCDRHSDKA